MKWLTVVLAVVEAVNRFLSLLKDQMSRKEQRQLDESEAKDKDAKDIAKAAGARERAAADDAADGVRVAKPFDR